MEKKKYGHFKSRSEEIFKIMKEGKFWAAEEICSEFNKNKEEGITLPGVIKILKKLIVEGKISYFDLGIKTNKSKFPKKYKEELLETYGRKSNPKVSKYYIHLPLNLKFREGLKKILGEKYNALSYQKKIWEMTRIFGTLEVRSKKIEKHIKDGKNTKKNIKTYLVHEKIYKKGMKITQEQINWTNKSIEKFIEMFEANDVIAVKHYIKSKNISGKQYFLVGEEYVSLDKLERFLTIIPITRVMKIWVYLSEINKEKIPEVIALNDLILKMYYLFIDLIEDSQIKV